MNKIRILLADDHKIVRLGLRALLSAERDLTVVGEAEDGAEAVSRALKLRPDVVVMDLMMPEMSGRAATEALHEKLPDTRIVILTSVASSDGIARTLEAGATGAVMKTSDDTALLSAIRAAAAGKRFISPDVKRLLASNPPSEPLTPRQRDVLQSLTQGHTNRDISIRLGISETRVEKLVNSLMAKIGAANRTEAVAIALREQLLKL